MRLVIVAAPADAADRAMVEEVEDLEEPVKGSRLKAQSSKKAQGSRPGGIGNES
jgi:hypothetical protein